MLVTGYDNSTITATSTWAASTSGAEVYAVVMDGYAAPGVTTGPGIFPASVSSLQHRVWT